MKKFNSIMAAVTLLTVASAATLVSGCKNTDSGSGSHVHQYTCPMHPQVMQSTAGSCPQCGMKLVHKD